MSKGPLAVRWGAPPAIDPHAGAVAVVRVELENAGTVAWRAGVNLAYHWLDDRDNPIVWDGDRTAAPALAPGERGTVDAKVRAPIPPGRYRLALDLVAENRAWFSELGSRCSCRTCRSASVRGEPQAELPDGVEPAPDWQERVARGARRGVRGRRRRDRLGAAGAGPHALARLRARARAGSPASRAAPLPVGAPRASSSTGSTTSPGCRRSPRRAASPGSTTAGSCSACAEA